MEPENIITEIAEEKDRASVCVTELRKLLQDETNLDCPMDDEFLVRFVRARKYDVEATFRNMKSYYGIRLKYPESFAGLHPSRFQKILETGPVGVLKHRDEMNRKVFVFRVGSWNAELFPFDDVVNACLLVAEEMTYCEKSQKVGAVVVVDHQGLNMSHAKQLSVNGFRKLLQLFQDCFPARYKAIHLVNQPYLFDFFFSAAKRFMSSKIRNRIHFHPGYESLSKSVSPDILAQSLGGNVEEDVAWDVDLINRLFSRDKFYQDLLQYGYKA